MVLILAILNCDRVTKHTDAFIGAVLWVIIAFVGTNMNPCSIIAPILLRAASTPIRQLINTRDLVLYVVAPYVAAVAAAVIAGRFQSSNRAVPTTAAAAASPADPKKSS